MTNEPDARPEAWPISVNKKTGEAGSIGPLWAAWTDVGYAYVSDIRAHFEADEPGVIDRVARLPITEWERDRAVERAKVLEVSLARLGVICQTVRIALASLGDDSDMVRMLDQTSEQVESILREGSPDA